MSPLAVTLAALIFLRDDVDPAGDHVLALAATSARGRVARSSR